MRNTFSISPVEFLGADGLASAKKDLRDYLDNYTGSQFDVLAERDEPNRITANDIVAVSTLSVDIPSHTAIWILGEGAAVIEGLLREIPAEQPIFDPAADLSETGPAWTLWNALEDASWGSHHGYMKATKTSKLMATKRPHLIPIEDRLIRDLICPGELTNSWLAWQHEFLTRGDELASVSASLRESDSRAADLTDLRLFDIALWMRAHKAGIRR